MRRLGVWGTVITVVLSGGILPCKAWSAPKPTDTEFVGAKLPVVNQSNRTASDSLSRKGSFTFELRNVTLKAALDTIRTRARIELLYGVRVVPLDRRVSLVARNISATEALTRVLHGTGITLRIVNDGQILLIKRDTLSQDSAVDQRTGSVRGVVLDEVTRKGLPQVRVTLGPTQQATTTDDEGRFTFPNLPPGTYRLNVRLMGYKGYEREVRVETAVTTVDIVLPHTAMSLREVVTTGAGDRERYKVGNSIATINADSVVNTHAIGSLSDLLHNRAPGVQVSPSSGAVGAAQRIRIRGLQSISGSNDPIIIVDGIRVTNSIGKCRDANSSSARSCADITSRFDDIDPDIIESVDVLKGPAASTLYGSDAANGVIVVKTKHGRSGPTRVRVHGDHGISYYSKMGFPTFTRAMGGFAAGGFLSCGFLEITTNNCGHIDTVLTSNPLSNSGLRPWARGTTTDIGIEASGGYERLQFFLAAGYEDQLGTSKMPTVNQDILYRARGTRVNGNIVRPNAHKRINATGRLSGQFGPAIDFSLNSRVIQRNQRRGTDGLNDIFSFRLDGDTTTLSRGWSEFFWEKDEHITHTTNSVSTSWRSYSWLSANATYGFDFSMRDDKDLARRDACVPFCSQPWYQDGIIRGGRQKELTHTVDLGAVLTIPVNSSTVLRTSFGGQYTRMSADELYGEQYDLAIGQTRFRQAFSIQNPNSPFRSLFDQTSNERAMAGMYLDQSIAFRDRLFVNAAFRRDMSSDLGPDGVEPTYPKFGLSWVASQEPFFPWKDHVNLRIRTAYGHAGVQPGSTARLRLFSAGQDFYGGQPVNTAYLQTLGNHFVRPERTVEQEYGFELGLLDERLRFDVTRYRKFTRDALVDRELPPSLGAGGLTSATRSENIGDVRNTGVEVMVDADILRYPSFVWSTRLAYASRRNLLVKLGQDIDPFYVNGEQSGSRVIEGYPLFGRWARPILDYDDANGDHMISKEEIVIGDSMVYLGPSQAKYDLSINHNIGLLQSRLQIALSMQYQHGLVQLNRFMADNVANLAVLNVIGAGTLREQAYAMASLRNPYASSPTTAYGFIETTNLLRLNNLSFTYYLPSRFARVFRSQSASVGILGTNLGLWSNYQGGDPENNVYGAGGNLYVDGGQFPRPRSWTFRLNLNF